MAKKVDDPKDDSKAGQVAADAQDAKDKKEWDSGVAISRRFLLGDLVKHTMRHIQGMQVGWGMLTEQKQQQVIWDVERDCKEAVRRVVDLIAADGRVGVEVILEQIVFKDGLKIVCVGGKLAEHRHAIADAAGGRGIIVLPGSGEYMAGDMPKPQPDQPGLLEEGSPKDPDAPVIGDATT